MLASWGYLLGFFFGISRRQGLEFLAKKGRNIGVIRDGTCRGPRPYLSRVRGTKMFALCLVSMVVLTVSVLE